LYPDSQGFVQTWENILHVGVNGDDYPYGARNPAVWMFYPNKLLIDAAVDGHHEHNVLTDNLPQDSWTKVSISQLKMDQGESEKM